MDQEKKEQKEDIIVANLHYFQKQFDQNGNGYQYVLGIGNEQIFNNSIIIDITQDFKLQENKMCLMKKQSLNKEQLNSLLTEFNINQEDIDTYIYDRSDEIIDQINQFHHKEIKERALMILANRVLVIYEKEDIMQEEQKYTNEQAIQFINEYFNFIGLKQDESIRQTERIIYRNSNRISDQMEELKCQITIKQEPNQELFMIPTFKKETVNYDWNNMFKMPDSLLNL